MANKVVLVDDLNGEPADETLRFAIDGVDYLIDLSTANANQLRELVKPYIQAGRRAVPPAKERKRGSRPQNIELDMIRYWANERGYTVANHGRIPNVVVEAYRHANP